MTYVQHGAGLPARPDQSRLLFARQLRGLGVGFPRRRPAKRGCGKTTRGSPPTTTRCRTGASSTTPIPDWDDLCRQWNKSNYTQFDTNIDWEISDRVSLLSTTGFSDFSSSGVSDWQLLGMEFGPRASNPRCSIRSSSSTSNFLDGKIDLITGVNYFNEDSGSPRESVINAFGSSILRQQRDRRRRQRQPLGLQRHPRRPVRGPVRRLRTTGDGSVTQESTAYGLFANSTIHFTERLNLTLGVRESHDEKALVERRCSPSDNFIPQFGGSTIGQRRG